MKNSHEPMAYSYMNEDQIDVELKCIICDEPFQSPVNCLSCGNTFCQSCIESWTRQQSTCPSCRQQTFQYLPVVTRVVLNQLNRLLVKCNLCEQMNIQRSNFLDHLGLICPKQIISCPDRCAWRGKREDLNVHLIQCRRKRSIDLSFLLKWIVFPLFILMIALLIFIVINRI